MNVLRWNTTKEKAEVLQTRLGSNGDGVFQHLAIEEGRYQWVSRCPRAVVGIVIDDEDYSKTHVVFEGAIAVNTEAMCIVDAIIALGIQGLHSYIDNKSAVASAIGDALLYSLHLTDKETDVLLEFLVHIGCTTVPQFEVDLISKEVETD